MILRVVSGSKEWYFLFVKRLVDCGNRFSNRIRLCAVSLLPVFLTFFISIDVCAQDFIPKSPDTERIVFYNLENLFDTKNDSCKNDEEFLPDGIRYWNDSRFYSKLKNIYKVLMACGTPEPPSIIGICEVENDFVIRRLIETTPLKSFGYKYIHYESPDLRGMDCALLYREKHFELFDSRPHSIKFPFDTLSATRDILYVKGLLFGRHLVHLFVNHWPSRYGGQAQSMPKRNYIAGQLRLLCDSILRENPQANILIMGDMNDDPSDESLKKHLTGKRSETDTLLLTHQMLRAHESGKGTIKHGAFWSLFDHLLTSPALTNGSNGLEVCSDAVIFDFDFLFMDDDVNMDRKLFRTYNGMSYLGGFSDHLPVGIDIKSSQ